MPCRKRASTQTAHLVLPIQKLTVEKPKELFFANTK